jgi:hypothetical protein
LDSKKLLAIGIQKRNKEIDSTWQELAEEYGGEFFQDGDSFRCWVKNQVYRNGFRDIQVEKSDNDELETAKEKYKEEVQIHNDGSQTSNKLVKMSLQDSKNPEFLLKAHGYDVSSWELISARSNIWNTYSKKHGIQQLYSSTISVRPLKNGFSIEKLIESFDRIKPFEAEIEKINITNEQRLLEIPLFDAHFGISDYEYYKPTQARIMTFINSKKWQEILFVVGQDLIHNNDFKGNTANGTHIEVVDMQKAWEDCCKFYEPLINRATKQSGNVKIIYSKGNHDETISWAFVKYLAARFPEAIFDDDFEERKIHIFNKIFIGITHGDKANNKDLANIFIKEFSLEWANAEVKEIHKGHYHIEDGKDVFGTMVRTLCTRNKTDKWHKDKGFVGAYKRFMLFEYSENELEDIHYV